MRAAAWAESLNRDDPAEIIRALATAVGFGEASQIDQATRRALGLPDEFPTVRLARGPGTTRMIAIVSDDESPVREQATRVANRLSRKAPHLLWLLVLVTRDRAEVVVAAWHAGDRSARIAALIVNRRDVLHSDAETLSALTDSLRGSTDLDVHAQWVEILGRESISRRFFLALHSLVLRLGDGASGNAPADARREVALLHVSRLLFLAFLEERGWLDGNHRYLAKSFDDCLTRGGRFQQTVLEPLFFGTLNTPAQRRAPLARALGRIPFLNGGLFTRTAVERRTRNLVIRDEDFGELFDQLLVRYRFTSREETDSWEEAAIDPEMLGRAFESLMASRERRITGAFYTPNAVVTRVADTALEALLVRRGAPDGILERVASVGLDPASAAALRNALMDVRVLDPACGSGAFLVHALDRLTQLRLASGEARGAGVIRRDVVTRSVFGVDLNPTAVWLCELRLWLALVIDHPAGDPADVPPLPNLDHNIRCGDTLLGGDFSHARRQPAVRAGGLRARYARASGARKRSLGRALDRMERGGVIQWLDAQLEQVTAQRRSLVSAARGRDLFGARRGALADERHELQHLRATARQLRARRMLVASGGALPFAFAAHFPDVARAGGFDVIVGNPPWIRVHNIPAAQRAALRREFRVYREAAWVSGARSARAGAGFGSQIDVASLFVERSHQLLRPDGVMALLVPAKLWRSLAGGGVRRLLTERSSVLALEDWSAAPAMFDAATYPSLIAATTSARTADVTLAVHRGRHRLSWRTPLAALPLDETAGAPWLTLTPDARRAFDRLTRDGVPLAAAGLGVATLGVKCGCNDAFLVRAEPHFAGVSVTDGSRSAVLEPRLVRRLIRGESVRAWRADTGGECIVFPHEDDGQPLERLPPALKRWLLPWRTRLEARSDARGRRAWWSLYRVEGSRFDQPRVVWADLGRSLNALVLEAGDRCVPLNTCYVLRTRDLIDAMALAAYLNSPVANAWVGAVAGIRGRSTSTAVATAPTEIADAKVAMSGFVVDEAAHGPSTASNRLLAAVAMMPCANDVPNDAIETRSPSVCPTRGRVIGHWPEVCHYAARLDQLQSQCRRSVLLGTPSEGVHELERGDHRQHQPEAT